MGGWYKDKGRGASRRRRGGGLGGLNYVFNGFTKITSVFARIDFAWAIVIYILCFQIQFNKKTPVQTKLAKLTPIRGTERGRTERSGRLADPTPPSSPTHTPSASLPTPLPLKTGQRKTIDIAP